MKYNTAFPYFPEKEIKIILHEFGKLLEGDGQLSMGKYVEDFEQKFAAYIGSRYSIATTSCTAALETLLRAAKIGVDDEVIIPCQTFIATASSVVRCGAKPVFAEINENFLLNLEDMKLRVTSKTKAVIMVHFAGLIDYKIFEIRKWLKENGILLIEDAAHAHGASRSDMKAGNIGEAAVFSFYSTKNMTTGEGGMITTSNNRLAESCASIRDRGLDQNANVEIFSELGTNQRLSEVQALMGLSQLKYLDEFVNHRNKVAEVYKKCLQPFADAGRVRMIEYDKSSSVHAYWRYIVFMLKNQNRSQIQERMSMHSVKIDWAYQPLVHLQPIMKSLFNTHQGNLPFSEKLAETHLCLPIHMNVSVENAKFISKKIIEYL